MLSFFQVELKVKIERKKIIFLISSDPRLPIDSKTPFGYLVAWLISTTGLIATATTVILLINSVVAACWFFIFMVDDIKKDLIVFNNGLKGRKNWMDQMKRYCDNMHIYSDAKE